MNVRKGLLLALLVVLWAIPLLLGRGAITAFNGVIFLIVIGSVIQGLRGSLTSFYLLAVVALICGVATVVDAFVVSTGAFRFAAVGAAFIAIAIVLLLLGIEVKQERSLTAHEMNFDR